MSFKRYPLFSLAIIAPLFFAATALAWAGPTASAPGSNTAAPINVGSVSQVKTGGIWASSVGSDSGYCIGASCISSWPVAGATTWLTNGSSIYYSAGKVGVGTSNPNRGLDISTNGGSDGVTIGQDTDNSETIQGYIDGQWAARTTYASGCCNLLKIQPDIGDTQIGPSVKVTHAGLLTASTAGIGTTNPGTMLQVGNGGDGWASGFTIQSNYPTIYLRDVDGRGAMIHNNGDMLYVLRACTTTGVATNANDWCAYNSRWPLSINLDTNDATFGGNIDNRGSVMYSNRYYDDDPSYYVDSNSDSQMNIVYANQFLYRSDVRLKKDIQPLTGTLDQVLSLQPVSFLWKDASLSTSTQIGFIAQQVQKVVPQLVSTNPSTGMEAVDYARVTPLLVGSVQTLNQKIDAQQQEIDQLKADIAALKKR